MHRKELMKKCIVCEGGFFKNPLMTLPDMPASAQDIPDKDRVASDRGITLSLVQCRECGLVQFDTTPVAYYRDVIRAGGGTKTMVELRRGQYAEFIERFDLKGKRIVEVGCGQGEFLQVLGEFDVVSVGLEHSAALVQKAADKGLTVHQGFVEDADSCIPGAPYDAFVQFNFLEHQPHPNDMLRGIWANLTEGGVGLVTVPSFEYILRYDGFYELIRDHLAYYDEQTLRFLFEKNGFEVVRCQTVNRDTLAVMVQKRRAVSVPKFTESYAALKEQFGKYLGDRKSISTGEKRRGGVAVWGASHQAFTLLATLGIGGQIEYIIDSAPFKQNRYAPASHVPIVAPDHWFEQPVGSIIIVAPGYTDEIAAIIRQRFDPQIEIWTLRSDRLERI